GSGTEVGTASPIDLSGAPEGATSGKAPSAAAIVFECWQRVLNHPRAKLGEKEERLIKARLREGYSVEDLCLVPVGASKSDWHMGRDPQTQGKRYDGIGLLYRSADQVNKFIELAGVPETNGSRPMNMIAECSECDEDGLKYVPDP